MPPSPPRIAPAIDDAANRDMLPPGASIPPALNAVARRVDNSVELIVPPSGSSTSIDALLPPGADAAPVEERIVEQIPPPEPPQLAPPPFSAAPSTPLAFPALEGSRARPKQRGKTAPRAQPQVEVRQLSSEVKAQRRLRKNAIVFGLCLIVLTIVFYLLAR
jgi:hypothetical protein